MAVGLCVYVFVWTARRPNVASVPFDRTRLRSTAIGTIGPAFVPVILLGGILSGTFTPTEAASVAVLLMIVLGLVYRTLTLRVLMQALRETAAITGGIGLILGSAALLGLILTRAHVSRDVAGLVAAVSDEPWVFMLMVNIVMLILGTVVDAVAAILVTVPVLLPIAVSLGIDPVYFGVVMIINLMIGLLTPPVGSVLFVTASVTGRPVEEVFRGIVPFLIPLLAVLVLVSAFPAVSLWLPKVLGF
jgi:tripartite ATP-independent transporter DctM subunit